MWFFRMFIGRRETRLMLQETDLDSCPIILAPAGIGEGSCRNPEAKCESEWNGALSLFFIIYSVSYKPLGHRKYLID